MTAQQDIIAGNTEENYLTEQTEPRRAEAGQTAERLRLMIESVKDCAIFMLDADGKVLTWNLGAERMTGYCAEEIIGQHFSTFYTEEAVKSRHPDYELKVARETGRFEEEGWRIRKNGDRFWANVSIVTLFSEGVAVGFTKVTRDLTERKSMEDQLRKAKDEAETARENYRMLTESVKDYAIYMLDTSGYIQSWNAGAERIKGYQAEEIIGRHFSVFYPREDVDAGKCSFELKYAELEGSYKDESWHIRKDGSKFWANVLITALRDENGTLIGFSKIIRDETQRKEVEIALQESEKRYRQMSEKVMERSWQFETLSKRLEVVNKELEGFSYSVSHDLRAPLRSINGFSKALLSSKLDQLDTEGRHYLNRITEAAQQMSDLIEGLITLSQFSKTPLEKRQVDLSRMAESIVADLREQQPDRLVKIIIQENLIAEGDSKLLRAVLQNLLANAWKFTGKLANPDQSDTDVSKTYALIEFGQTQKNDRQKNDQLVYFVRDNGAGFDMAYSNKLFGVFQRLHDQKEFLGNGIGLATVQRIIHRHGGEIWAEGEVGKGATFYFTLS